MKTIKTQSNSILVVEVPEGAKKYEYIEYYKKYVDHVMNFRDYIVFKDSNPYCSVILGKLSELENEELEKFVENDYDGAYFGGFWEYTGPKNYTAKGTDWKICNSTKESFISLLQSNEIDTSKELLILETL